MFPVKNETTWNFRLVQKQTSEYDQEMLINKREMN